MSLWGLILCKIFNYHDPAPIGAGLWICGQCGDPL
jgi:hypothetical protein